MTDDDLRKKCLDSTDIDIGDGYFTDVQYIPMKSLTKTVQHVSQTTIPLMKVPSKGSSSAVRVGPGAGAESTAWPTSTRVHCWWCCHPFDSTPIPLPIEYDDKLDEFKVQGVFCSWGCVKTYNASRNCYTKSVAMTLISLLHKRCIGTLTPIQPAPPREALAVFGGTMSIDEFRKVHDNVCYHLMPPKMIAVQPRMVETQVKLHRRPDAAAASSGGAASARSARDVAFDNVGVVNEPLRIRRNKPLPNSKNTLERSMGINFFEKHAAARQP